MSGKGNKGGIPMPATPKKPVKKPVKK